MIGLAAALGLATPDVCIAEPPICAPALSLCSAKNCIAKIAAATNTAGL
jgi:hypothetical protein